MITPRLSLEALQALRNATTTEDSVSVPPLDRVSWQQVNAALVLIVGGGNWNRERRAWVFPRSPERELRAFLAATQEPHAQFDDSALVPAGPLLELAERLDAAAATVPVGEVTEAERRMHAHCHRIAATAIRAAVYHHACTEVSRG